MDPGALAVAAADCTGWQDAFLAAAAEELPGLGGASMVAAEAEDGCEVALRSAAGPEAARLAAAGAASALGPLRLLETSCRSGVQCV